MTHPTPPPTLARVAVGLVSGLAVVWLTWDDSDLGRDDRRWALAGAVVVAALVAWALPAVSRRLHGPGSVPLLAALTLAAIYGCVPETDQVAPVLAALGALAGVEVLTRGQLSWWWHGLAAWLVLWAGLYGATGRPSALAGALFAWWPFVLTALAAALAPDQARSGLALRWLPALSGVAAAVLVARTGALAAQGVASAVWTSALAATASIVMVLAGLAVSARRARPRR